MSNDLYELADDLKLGKFFLAGHSMGGKTAVCFAYKWPERLSGLLVADISPFANEGLNSEMAAGTTSILNSILSVNPSDITSRREAGSILAGRIADERTRGLILKNLERNSDNSFSWKINASSLLNNLDKIMEAVLPYDAGSNQITGFPVYFLKGETSDYLPEMDFTRISENLPCCRIHYGPRCRTLDSFR